MSEIYNYGVNVFPEIRVSNIKIDHSTKPTVENINTQTSCAVINSGTDMCGTISLTYTGTVSVGSEIGLCEVTFNKPFKYPPYVFLTVTTDLSNFVLSVVNVTQTTFEVYLNNTLDNMDDLQINFNYFCIEGND